jgi:hypothetical protein
LKLNDTARLLIGSDPATLVTVNRDGNPQRPREQAFPDRVAGRPRPRDVNHTKRAAMWA